MIQLEIKTNIAWYDGNYCGFCYKVIQSL